VVVRAMAIVMMMVMVMEIVTLVTIKDGTSKIKLQQKR
jgi:hypothetical protein